MPCTLIPGAALKVSFTQSDSAPGTSSWTSSSPVEADPRLTGGAVQLDRHRHRQRRVALPEHVLGALDAGLEPGRGDAALPTAAAVEDDALPALLELGVRGPGGEEQEGALGAQQVGDAHRRQLGAVEAVGREGDRHPQHRAPDPVLAEDRPERRRLAQQAQDRLLQRDAPAADLEEAVDAADLRRRQHRQVGLPVAVEEVEDVVLGRVDAGRERRPGHRRHRREGGAQAVVAAGGRQLGEVGELALGEQAVGEPRVLAVEADDDEAADPRLAALLAGGEPPQLPERPQQHREDRHHQGDEEDQERRQQGEAGAGADVGRRRERRGEGGRERQQGRPGGARGGPPGGARAGLADGERQRRFS